MGEYVFVIHPVAPVRQHLIYTLAKAGWLVTAPEDAAVERQAEKNGPPAVLICDGGLDDPIAEPTYSRQNGGPPRVLAVLTEEESDLGQFAQGHLVDADDFLVWPADDAEILLRVRRLAEARARAWRPAPPRDHGDGTKHFAGRPDGWEENQSNRLSRIEREIMRRLEAASGAVVPIAALADSIAAESPKRQMSTLRVHISRLRKKLELDPRQPRYIVTVRGIGYRLGAEPPMGQ